jgi:hypothetical protein
MKGEHVLSFSLKKSNQAVALPAKTKTKSDSDCPTADIDPQLMFQRLTTAVNGLFWKYSRGIQI